MDSARKIPHFLSRPDQSGQNPFPGVRITISIRITLTSVSRASLVRILTSYRTIPGYAHIIIGIITSNKNRPTTARFNTNFNITLRVTYIIAVPRKSSNKWFDDDIHPGIPNVLRRSEIEYLWHVLNQLIVHVKTCVIERRDGIDRLSDRFASCLQEVRAIIHRKLVPPFYYERTSLSMSDRPR